MWKTRKDDFMFGGKQQKKETKEDKQERKVNELLTKYGLDELTNQTDIQSVKNISANLVGTGMLEFGGFLSGSISDGDKILISVERSIMEQNWIIIRQLDRLNNLLAQQSEK